MALFTAGFMTQVTCRLTAKNRDQLRNPTLNSRVWATFLASSMNRFHGMIILLLIIILFCSRRLLAIIHTFIHVCINVCIIAWSTCCITPLLTRVSLCARCSSTSQRHLTMSTTTSTWPNWSRWVYLTSSCAGCARFCVTGGSAWRLATCYPTGCSWRRGCRRGRLSARWCSLSWSTRCSPAVWRWRHDDDCDPAPVAGQLHVVICRRTRAAVNRGRHDRERPQD